MLTADGKEFKVRRIRHLFLRLRTVFPMLGSAEEKGTYFLQSFAEDHDRYPMLQHLFDKEFYRHKLLWGEDVLNTLVLPPLQERDLLVTYLWKLRYWVEKVLFYIETERLTKIQQVHTFYKAISNVSHIFMKLVTPDSDLSNDAQILYLVRRLVDVEDVLVIDALRACHCFSYRKIDTDPESFFLLFKRILARCVQVIGEKLASDGHSYQGAQMDSRVPKKMTFRRPNRQWLLDLRRLCGDDVRIEVVKTVSIPINPLDCLEFGAPTYLIICDNPITLKQIKGLQAFFRHQMSGVARLMIQESPWFIYAVHSGMLESWMLTPIEEQYVFQSWFPFTQTYLDPGVALFLLKRLRYQVSEIRFLVAGSQICRMDLKTYWRFFFSSLQRLILYRSMIIGRFLLPATAQEVCLFLRENTPLSKQFIDLLLSQNPSDLGRDTKRPFVNLKKTRLLIQRFSDIVEKNVSFEELIPFNSMEDHQKTTISVVVITRNRAQQLDQCLNSVWNQRRLPDEVVVVDNASTDLTKEIVTAFSGSRKIHYVYEPILGVSRARNTGVRIAISDIVAFLDDDAIADTNWLFHIEEAFAKDDRIGIVGGAIHHMEEARSDMSYRYHALQEGN